ncbi:hypothetical protein R1sor_022785 [Riccia sorocarpa]|uniref:Transposase n=1 Tax=Riccia sorocarpa TaxID=122646 RepID=A0ABD3GN23_9MARC
MDGVNYMDGSDIDETIFTPEEMTLEEWEALNDHRWYRESLVYSHVLNVGGVNNVNPSILENWQRSARNLRGEMDIGGKTLHEDTDFLRERKELGNLVSGPLVNPVGALKDWNRLMFSRNARNGRIREVGVKGGCGEKDRYDAAQMVRFTHADSDGDDLDEEDIEGDEEDCDDDPKKVGHLHKWMGATSKALWLAQVFGDRITLEYRRPVGQLQTEFRMQYTRDVEYMPMFRMRKPDGFNRGVRSPDMIIVSDRQKGLEKAVAEVLPINFHMHCAHHLKMNVQKHFGTAAGKAFLTLVYINSQAKYLNSNLTY